MLAPLAAVLALASPMSFAADGALPCGAPEAAAIRLRLGGDAQSPVIDGLIGGVARAGLALRDARSGAILWTAGTSPAAVLPVPAMDALIIAAPAPVDLDGDGLHDRLYVADTAGRVWRLDLHNGEEREDWARAVLFADLSGGGARGFFAAPDVALHDARGQRPWISIALGSLSFESGTASNRFYVLRDSTSPLPQPPDLPLQEADLRLAEGVQGVGDLRDDETLRGFYVPLGSAQVLAPSLTLNGVIVFSAALPSIAGAGCSAITRGSPARVEVHAIAAQDGALALDLNGSGALDAGDSVLALAGQHTAGSAIRIGTAAGNAARPAMPCLIDAEPIPGCAVATGLRRRYWLREDAD